MITDTYYIFKVDLVKAGLFSLNSFMFKSVPYSLRRSEWAQRSPTSYIL